MKYARMFSFIILLAALTGCGGEAEKPTNRTPAAANANIAVPTPSATVASVSNVQPNTSVGNSNGDREDVRRSDRPKAANSNNTDRRDRDDSREGDDRDGDKDH